MALFHQYSGSEEGKATWDEWSQNNGGDYNPKLIETKWPTFREDLRHQEPTTAATILHIARVSKDQAGGDKLQNFIERYIYVEAGDLVCDLEKPPHHCISKIGEFRNRTANVMHEVPAPTKKRPDNTKLEPVSKAWMIEPNRKSAEGVRYAPQEPRVITDADGLQWVNEFHMPSFVETTATDKLDIFHAHMNYILPIKVEREWFIDFLAMSLQRPQERCKVTPLLVTKVFGTGRGWIVKAFEKMAGEWNCSKTKMATLAGEGSAGAYQDYLNKSIMCAIEEVKESHKRFSVSDRIRDLLTEPRLEINLKYGGKRTQTVYTNFFFMTNHPDAIVIPVDDRRINVFTGPTEVKNNAYYTRLYGWLETEGLVQLYNYLMRRDLSNFNWQRSFDTPARRHMIESNQSETEELFLDFIKAPPAFAMTFAQINEQLARNCGGDTFDSAINENQLLKLLQNHCRRWKQVKIQGKKPRPWILSNDSDEEITNESVRQAVLSLENT